MPKSAATLPVPPSSLGSPNSGGGSKPEGQAGRVRKGQKGKEHPPGRRIRKDTSGNSAPGAAGGAEGEDEEMFEEAQEEVGAGAAASPPRRKANNEEKEEGIGKKKGQVAKTSGGMKRLLRDLLKSVLSLQQGQRSLASVVFDVVLLSAENPGVVGMAEQGRAYAQVEDKSAIGSPHLFIFGGLLKGVVSAGEKIGQSNLKELTQALTEYEDMEDEDRGELVVFAKLDRTYKADIKRVTLSLDRWQYRKSLLSALQQLGGTRKQGRAPRGAQERELEQWLAALTEQ